MLTLALCLAGAPVAVAAPAAPAAVAPAAAGVIWIRVLNAPEVAAATKGAWVSALGLLVDVDDLAQAAIAESLRARLAERGVQAAVDRVEVPIAASQWLHWDPTSGETRTVELPAGSTRLIRVDVQNVDELVAREKSAGVVRVAKALGVDLKSKVNARVAEEIFLGMADGGVRVAIRVE